MRKDVLRLANVRGRPPPVQTVHGQRDEAAAGDGQSQEDTGHGVDLTLRGPLQVSVVGRRLENTSFSLSSEKWPNADVLFYFEQCVKVLE